MEISREFYRYNTAEKSVENEQEFITPILKAEFREGQGFLAYLEGAPYPKRGFATPESLAAVNLSKRLLVAPVKLLKRPYMWPILFSFALWPFKVRMIEDLIDYYCSVSWRVVSPFVLKEEFMMESTRETEYWVYLFLDELGIKPHLREQFAQIFALNIESDNAYALRLQDILSETSGERLGKNPIGEIWRLVSIFSKRQGGDIQWKFKGLAIVVIILLFNGKIRKAFKKSLTYIKFDKIQLDQIDRYWCLVRKEDYKYLGLDNDERGEILVKEKLKRPKLIPRINVK